MWLFCAPHWVKDLWPRPNQGLDAVHDSLAPLPYREAPATGQSIHRAERGTTDEGAYVFQGYNVGKDQIMTRSLARQMMYTIAYTVFKLGGPHYPADYGFGPGAHYDATPEMGNVQQYMRPGIKLPVSQGGRQLP